MGDTAFFVHNDLEYFTSDHHIIEISLYHTDY